MSKQTLSIGADPAIELERAGGDLVIEGWERAELEAQGDGLQVDREGNSVSISGGGDLKLSVPRGEI